MIDLDAYGVCYDQLKILFDRKYKGHVFFTMIQSVMGMMPMGLLNEVGFTDVMIRKAPTLFGKRGWKYFLEYLALHGVTKIWHKSHARKHYGFFIL